MKRVGRDASLHERTVMNLPSKSKRKRTARESDPVITITQVHPGVWATALRLAGGDASRITVLSPTRVEVR